MGTLEVSTSPSSWVGRSTDLQSYPPCYLVPAPPPPLSLGDAATTLPQGVGFTKSQWYNGNGKRSEPAKEQGGILR